MAAYAFLQQNKMLAETDGVRVCGPQTPFRDTTRPPDTKRISLPAAHTYANFRPRLPNPETPVPAEPAQARYPHPDPASGEDAAPAHAARRNARSR